MPPAIEVWVCPTCGYWREKRDTGVHMDFPDAGPGRAHTLEPARYIYEGRPA
jgi:hypothetical protein